MTDIEHSRASILMVANFSPDVGFAWWLMERFWLEIADLARARNLKVILAYPSTGKIPKTIAESDIEVQFRPIPTSTAIGLGSALKFMKGRSVKAVYFTDRTFGSLNYAMYRMVGVLLIITHDHTPGDRPPVTGLKGLVKKLWRRMPGVSSSMQLCVSPLIRERAIDNARIPRSRTAVVQNGIDAIHCEGGENYLSDLLGLASDVLFCVTVARASSYKRIDFAIEVARRCIKSPVLTRLHFVHCGTGPDLDALKLMVEAAGLADRFHFLGKRSDIHKILCSAEFALHPAKGEAFSLAILEYMSAGLVTLVPDIPTVCQAIEHGHTGFIYEDGNHESVISHLKWLVENPAAARSLGTAAASMVDRDFSMTKMVSQFRKIFAEQLDDALG